MLVKDSILYLAARALPAVFSLAAIAVITRVLSPMAYGRYALIIAGAGVLNALCFSWVTAGLFRFYAASKNSGLSPLIATALQGMGVSLPVAASVAILASLQPSASIAIGAAAACIIMATSLAWSDFTSFYINLERRSVAYATFQMGRALLNLLAGGSVAYLTASPIWTVIAIAMSQLALTLIPIFRTWVHHLQWNDRSAILRRKLLAYGLPLSCTMTLLLLIGFVERAILSHLMGNKAVGEFAVAYDLTQFTIGAIASALSLAFYPMLLAMVEEKGEASARIELRNYAAVQFSVLLPAAIGLAMVAPGLVHLIVGAELQEGALQVVPWLCAGLFLNGMKAFYTDFSFQITKWTGGGLICGLIMLAVSVALNLALVPRYGAIGTAQASLVTFATGLVASIILGRAKGLPLSFPIRDYSKVAVAAIIMGAAILPMRGMSGVAISASQVFIGIAVYVICLLALNPMELRAKISSAWLGYRFDRRQQGE